MSIAKNPFSERLAEATLMVFGDRPLTHAVADACMRYDKDVRNIQTGRGINALTLAIVGAKGQGKTWVARQLVRDPQVRELLRSGDLNQDATTRLVWVGPHAPDGLDAVSEIYYRCAAVHMVEIGQPYVLLDTPGVTDTNQRAAEIASDALSLAPIKLLVIARDQLRAAANLLIAARIDGSICIPIISSVEPDEMLAGSPAASQLSSDLRAPRDGTSGVSPGIGSVSQLSSDLRALRDQLLLRAPSVRLLAEVLVPDFDVSGDEATSSTILVGQLIDRLSDLELNELSMSSGRDARLQAAQHRLRGDVAKLIGAELPQLAAAVDRLNHETENLPDRVLASLLGSSSVLETGVRMRLRARLVSDTSLLWFPYRTVMSTLNLTQGAWDRVMLALAGSLPSLFGALASWAKNARQSRDFSIEVQDGIRQRTQRQVEERLKPLCDQFHRAVMKLRPQDERSKGLDNSLSRGLSLSGIDELQNRSQQIFDSAIESNATPTLLVQLFALVGTVLFWACMAGPIVVIYREYFTASWRALGGSETHLESFPHPSAGLLVTSLVLSLLPLAIFCMVVLTVMLSRRKVASVARAIIRDHEQTIVALKQSDVIRLEFEDELLQQAEFLLNLRRSAESP